jgi:GNAT superfamily N-acetyltransferase
MTTARPVPDIDLSKVKVLPLIKPVSLRDFSCGEREIDRSISKCCGWNEDHRAKTFCAFLDDRPKAVGFYTLSISNSNADYLHPDITRGALGEIPFMYINYLAVQTDKQGGGIGEKLLTHALDGCMVVAQNVGGFGVALHALTERAENLYYRYGFRSVDGKKYPFMILPIKALLDLADLKAQQRAAQAIGAGLLGLSLS